MSSPSSLLYTGTLTCTHVNINGIRNKIEELSNFIIEHPADILFISESKLNEKIPDSLVSLDGYSMIRQDRASKHPGGGLVIYHKPELKIEIDTDEKMKH